jgi:hypothetical protein
MVKRVEVLPPRSAVYFFLLAIDAAGVPHDEQKALTRLNAVSNSPIFSFSDSFFGHGIVGGPLLSVPDYSQQTANIAVRLLRGEAPSDVRMPPVGLSTPKFDWREMQRWGIPESRLPWGTRFTFATQPHGSSIVYRSLRSVLRFWRKPRWLAGCSMRLDGASVLRSNRGAPWPN